MISQVKMNLPLIMCLLLGAVLTVILHVSGLLLKDEPFWSSWEGSSSVQMGGGGGTTRDEGGTPEPTVTPGVNGPISTTYANLLPWPFRITSQFGQYPNGGAHFGLDLDATYGVIQTAPVGGVVEEVLRGCPEGDQNCGRGWGNHVWWQSDVTGHHILLAHFSKIEDWVQVGVRFEAGKPVGVTGSTGFSSGPHVHLQVNPERCCENPGSTNPAWEFPNLRCGEPVLGSRFGAACDQ